MRHAQQIHLRRQLVGRMAPVAVRKDGILPVGDGVLQLLLHSGEIRGGGQGPVGKGLGDGGGFRGSAFRADITSTQSMAWSW